MKLSALLAAMATRMGAETRKLVEAAQRTTLEQVRKEMADLAPATVTMTPGEPGPVGPPGMNGINGKDGKDGKDGRDGVAPEDVQAAVKAEVAKCLPDLVKAAVLERVVYKGTWRDGAEYVVGNFVTYGGSVWHCNADNAERPSQSSAWTLAVKHGRDARS